MKCSLFAGALSLLLVCRAVFADTTVPASPFTKDSAKAYIRLFVAQRLENDIDKLVSYNFMALETDKVFGNKDDREFDCDDCELSRAVFTLIWGESLPGLTGELGRGKKWRGDTMNSFRTVFGAETNGTFRGVAKFKAEKELLETARLFNIRYHTIGNFTPLPNYWNKAGTLNTYRAGPWKDFFDAFARELRLCMMNASGADKDLDTILVSNRHFFETRRTEADFVAFARTSLWDDYLDADGRPVAVFEPCWWWDRTLSRKDYIDRATKYATKAMEIIERRGRKIVDLLKKELD